MANEIPAYLRCSLVILSGPGDLSVLRPLITLSTSKLEIGLKFDSLCSLSLFSMSDILSSISFFKLSSKLTLSRSDKRSE